MLASITPLGERGRHSHWGITVVAFALAATAAGALAGALVGTVGRAVTLSSRARLGVVAAVVLGAILLDAERDPAPGPRRQVDERWLKDYRGWVYGAGYGAQLGLGITTVVTSAATYAAMLVALVSGSPGAGAMILGCYGAIRGISPLAAGRVRTPAQLFALHARLARWRERGARGGAAALACVALAAIIGSI